MGKTVWISSYDYPAFLDGFKSLGWQVLAGPERNWSAWAHGNVNEVPKGTPAEFGQYLRREVLQHRPNLVLIGKGLDSNVQASNIEPSYWHILPDDIKYARDQGAVVIQCDLDSPDSFGFVTNCGIARAVDAIGTCCIGTREFYKRHTTADVFEFWPAWDQALRSPPSRDPQVDLVIVGTPYLNPNGDFGLPRRTVAMEAIAMGLSVEIYGPAWDNEEAGGHPSLAPHWKGLAPWETLHLTLARGKVAYNSFLRRGFRYLNDRVPIAAGAGTFILSEEQLGLDGEFPEGTMVGYHQRANVEDFKTRLRWWVDHNDEREKAALAMQAYVLANHTWAHRAKVVESAYVQVEKRNVVARASACCGRGGSKN